MPRILLALLLTWLTVACGEVDRASSVPFEPPLLKDRDTSQVVREVQGPFSLPFVAEGTLQQGGFSGVTFETQGEVVSLTLNGQPSPSDRLALAVYGPRSGTGSWGEALLARAAHEAVVLRTGTLQPGRYLVLVGTVASESDGSFVLSAECEGECAADSPICTPATECSLVCPLGFVVDASGCETCACKTECVDEFDCPAGEVCTADFQCVPACQCNHPFAPVCGADGSTYANACEARCAGVTVASTEPCSTTCPPVACELTCANGFAADASGCEICACQGACDACSSEWAPVCTANVGTYLNACQAECGGDWVAYLGACRTSCQPLQCGAPCPQGALLDDAGCPTCECLQQPAPCQESGPVCGTDGVTYENSCAATAAQVAVVYVGTCPGYTCTGSAGCPDGANCVKPSDSAPCLSNSSEPGTCLGVCVRSQPCASLGTVGECPAGYACIAGECQTQCLCSAIYDPICGQDGVTYDNTCVAACSGVGIAKVGRCCAEVSACELACTFGFAVDGNGCPACACLERPPCACTELENPMCAAFPDGSRQTYLNRCWADCDGFTDAAPGACP